MTALPKVAFVALLGGIAAVAAPATAQAQSLIKTPGDHPDYRFEAEPHGLLGYAGPFGTGSVGIGFRGTVIILDRGFIPSINDTVGIGFGGDIFFGHGTFYVPVVLQWNFWLTPRWSVFGEPGLGIAPNPDHGSSTLGPAFFAGGRFHFNDRVSLTLRVGYPSISIGASFFL